MKINDLKNDIKVMDVATLIARAKALRIELSDLVLDKNINKLKNTKSMHFKKKELARVLTVMNQKKLIGNLESKTSEQAKESKVEKTENAKKGENGR